MDLEFVLFKLSFFLGPFVGFFVGIMALIYLLDKSRWGKALVASLAASSLESQRYSQLITLGGAAAAAEVEAAERASEQQRGKLSGLMLWSVLSAEEARTLQRRAATRTSDVEAADGTKAPAAAPSEYVRFLLLRRTYLGCSDVLFKKGSTLLGCVRVGTRGLLEDALLYAANYHKILACVLAIKGSPYPRSSRRVVFLMQHVLTFSLIALTNDIFRLAGVSSKYIGTFNSTVVPTLSISLNVLFRSIITSDFIRRKGRVLTSLIFGLGAFSLLVFAAISTSSMRREDLLIDYTARVFVISSLQELLLISLLFYPRMYLAVYMGRFPVLMVGRYFFERLLYSSSSGEDSSSAVDTDLLAVSLRLWGGVTVEWAYSKRGTMAKAAAVAAEEEEGEASREEAAAYNTSSIEMQYLDSAPSEDAARESVTVAIDEIHHKSPLFARAGPEGGDAVIVYESNPMHSMSQARASGAAGEVAGGDGTAEGSASAGIARSVKQLAGVADRRLSFVQNIEFFEERGIGAASIPSLLAGSGKRVTLSRSMVGGKRSSVEQRRVTQQAGGPSDSQLPSQEAGGGGGARGL